jgi:hypothetical protein
LENNDLYSVEAVENKNFTPKERAKKILLEFKDLLIGAAFPFMLMLILSASIISFVAYGGEDFGIKILILIVGEVMVYAAIFIFGKQNGATAFKKTLQNTKKRQVNSQDVSARLYVGEYAVYKGILIPLIACVPFIIFQFVQAVAPNDVCKFVLSYALGWAYFPFRIAELSDWLNFLWLIPFTGVHLGAYIWGGKVEKKKLEQLAAADEAKDKKKKK